MQSLFFQQLSYLMYNVHAKTAPKKVFSISLRKSIQNIIIIRDYLQKNVSLSNSLELKKSFTRIGVSTWNSILLSVKTLNIFNFRKKIKSVLLNVLGNEDN